MLSDALRSSTIPMLEQVANFSESRHAVLAGNLANIDTPGYHTRDLSPQKFQARLIEAIAQRNKGEEDAVVSRRAMAPAGLLPGGFPPSGVSPGLTPGFPAGVSPELSPGGVSSGARSPFAGSYDPVAHVGTAIDGMLYHDDNNRGLEQEVAAMTDNETQHSMALALLASQLKLIEAAVTEKA